MDGGRSSTNQGDVGEKCEDQPLKDFAVTKEHYLKDGAAKVFGTSNPTIMDKPLWKYLVYSKQDSWSLRQLLGFKTVFPPDYPGMSKAAAPPNTVACPNWCFSRFGSTKTMLSDGRKVIIAGEHEDFYDPDFCIYNDVVVVDTTINPITPKAITIYGYPVDVFPPTDFHTATLYSDMKTGKSYIYIIGGLGYPDGPHRTGVLVFRLNVEDFSIEKVETSGLKPEGELSHHRAELVDGGSGERSVVRITTSTPSRYLESRSSESEDGSIEDDNSEETDSDDDLFANTLAAPTNLEIRKDEGVKEDVEPEDSEEAKSEHAKPGDLEYESEFGEAGNNINPKPEEPFVEKVYNLDLITLNWS